jgi:hypothetical protein
MADSSKAAPVGAKAEGKRFRSEIEFPYADLEQAVELAHTIHTKAGSSCETDELAAWMGQTASGGTFRTRVGAARMFGLVETGGGRVTLTQPGRDVLDGSGSERAARVAAFLNVELFRVMYDQYKGNALPPPPALERQMEQLGVSPKQKERARQTFMKSATYAGFIDATSGRFVKPGIVTKEETPRVAGEQQIPFGGGDGGGPNDPVLKALIQKLPKQGPWSSEERANWMRMMTMAFDMAYGPGDWVIQIDKKP